MSAAAQAAIAAAAGTAGGRNVKVTVELGRVEGGRSTSASAYEMLTVADGEFLEFTTGSRIPIPTTTFNTAGPGAGAGSTPVTTFTYQHVGVRIKLRTSLVEAGMILLSGSIEASNRADEQPGVIPVTSPSFGNFSQQVNVLLKPGKKARIGLIEEPSRGTFYLDIKADQID